MGVTTVVPVVPAEPVRTARRSTPFRLRAWTALVAVCLAALLAATVAAFTAARDGTDEVAGRASVASEASDLYFALADLDAQSARLVLLGNGEPAVSGGTDYESNQLAALADFNERTTQAASDLRDLAANGSAGQDSAGLSAAEDSAVATLTAGVTEYHQIADAAVALDQTSQSSQTSQTSQTSQGGATADAGNSAATVGATDSGSTSTPDNAVDSTAGTSFGAPAGQPVLTSLGYYSRATTLMQGELLPDARTLRDATAADLSSAANSAHTAGLIGAVLALVLGIVAVVIVGVVSRRMARIFRRALNPGLVVAGLLALVLAGGGTAALLSTAHDSQTAANNFAGYLQVARARTDSYDADGDATRYLLLPQIGVGALNADLKQTEQDLSALGPAADDAAKRWHAVSAVDLPAVVQAQNAGDPAAALARDTGTARGQEAFDFGYYDATLITLSNQRLAAFNAGMSASHGDLNGWSWLPWALIAAALTALVLGVRPRLAEFR